MPLSYRPQKRTRAAEEGEPATSADQNPTPPEVIEISPQREEATQIPPISTMAGTSIIDVDEGAESNRREEEHHEEIPEEPVRIKDPPATDVAGDRATATDVAGGDIVPPQQATTCNFPFECYTLSSSST